jgi:predicted RNA-binding Zn ribbon-like protein
MPKNKDIEALKRISGRTALDFANTIDWAEDATPLGPEKDVLTDVEALLLWGTGGDLYGDAELADLRAAVSASEDGGASELAAAKALRAAMYRIFTATAGAREAAAAARPTVADLALVQRVYRDAVAAGRFIETDGAWRLAWRADDPRRVRFAVAVDAVELITSAELLARVKRCPGHHCGWLFFDASGRRRWCEMGTCGSRAKMRRQYAKKRLREQA